MSRRPCRWCGERVNVEHLCPACGGWNALLERANRYEAALRQIALECPMSPGCDCFCCIARRALGVRDE